MRVTEAKISNLTGYSRETMDLSQQIQPDVSIRILIPFWDVLLNYTILAMTFIAVTTMALQLSTDTLSCIVFKCPSQDNVTGMPNETCELLNNAQLTKFFNSQCFKLYDAIYIFHEAVIMLVVFNMCLVLDPHCSHTLHQFVRIVKECYECIGTPEQISSVLKSIAVGTEASNRVTPDDTNLDEASKTSIKTIYHKVKIFGNLQFEEKRLGKMSLLRAVLLIVEPVVCFIVNSYQISRVNELFSFQFSFTLLNLEKSWFRCIIKNQDEALPITYNHVLCSKNYLSYFNFAFFFFTMLLMVCLGFAILSQYPTLATWKSKDISKYCGKADLAFLCFLLKQYSLPEYKRFILFYSCGEETDVTVERGETNSATHWI